MIAWFDVACRSAFAAGACFALVANLLLLMGLAVPVWSPLPALVLGCWLAAREGAIATDRRTPPLVAAGAFVVVGAIAAAIAVGALATPSRCWDGVVAWDVRAIALTENADVAQPYFRDATVFAHSRDYPLLQPLLVATGNRLLGGDGGRLLFPLLYVLAIATVATALRRAGVRPVVATACAVACAVTPMLVNPTNGGADSGYADLLLLTAVTGIAAGLATRSRLQLASAVVLTFASKPEGLLYGLLPLVVAFVGADRSVFRWTLGAWCAAAAVVLPLQYRLNHFGAGAPPSMWGGIAGFALVLLLVQASAAKYTTRRTRLIAVVAVVPLAFVALPWLGAVLASLGGTMHMYFGDDERAWSRLPRLLHVLCGLFDRAFLRLRFAAAYWCALAAVAIALCRRGRAPNAATGFFGLAFVAVLVPFVLSPEQDLEHHLASTMSRLLLHWLGAAWIVVGLEWPDDSRVAAAERDLAPAS